MECVKQLAADMNTALFPPATVEEIKALEDELGYPLPSQVCDLYQITNGLALNVKSPFQRPSIMTIEQILEFLSKVGYWWDKRYLPLTENNSSNYFCVRCDDLMAGYIVYVPHDDGPAVCFRDVNTFLEGIRHYYGSASDLHSLDLDQLPSQFAQLERLPRDIQTAERLIASVKDQLDLRELDHEHSVYFALWLLNEPSAIAGMTRYLEIYKIKKRLNALPEKSAKPYLDSLTELLDAFTAHCIELIQQLGLTINEISRNYEQTIVSVGAKPNWVSMDGWYLTSRQYASEADFDAVFVERLKNPEYFQP